MSKLGRKLGLGEVFCVAAGAMISSGIFVLPGYAFATIGPAVFLAYLLGGLLALAGIVNVIELSTAMPCAGGDYFFITRSMGPLVGTIAGSLSWLAMILKSAFAIFGLTAVWHIMTGLPTWPAGIFFTLFFLGINLLGVKEALFFQIILVFCLMAIVGAFVIFGVPQVNIRSFHPLLLAGKHPADIFFTVALVFVSFGGMLQAMSLSEEVKNPGRNILFGIMAAMGIVTVLYVMILIVTVGVLPAAELANATTPIADAARKFWGAPGWLVITAGAVIAFLCTANAGTMAAARYPLAMSRDGFLPPVFSFQSQTKKTPVAALVLTAAVMMLAVMLPLESLVKAASAVFLASYMMSALAVIVLRESKVQNYRPTFRVPFYPFVQIFTIVAFGYLIFRLGGKALAINGGLIVVCALVYLIYGRQSGREFALMHLVERITNRRLTANLLEEELKNVVHDRDEVVKDEFDHLVEQAPVVDLADEHYEADTLFQVSAQALAATTHADPEQLFVLLKQRESEGSTMINGQVAIPHLIMDGSDVFQLLLVRCRAGVTMDGEGHQATAAFVIVGTRDRRNQHLKTLAAIAQLVSDPDFEKNWLAARGEQQLRDLLLLGRRKRLTPAEEKPPVDPDPDLN